MSHLKFLLSCRMLDIILMISQIEYEFRIRSYNIVIILYQHSFFSKYVCQLP